MKQIITKLSIVALMVSLAACSTNTRQDNTVVGAGTGAVVGGLLGAIGGGWVIAAGAVVGGVVGGVVGHSMDSTDTVAINTSMDKNSINVPSNWTNTKTGTWYKITPTSPVMAYKGSTYCRHYTVYTKHNGKSTHTNGVACRNSDGLWQQVR